MPFAGDYSGVNPNERVPLQMDFTLQIPGGDSLSNASATMSVYYGTDANAANVLSGSPNISGNIVTQYAGAGWVAGVVYRLTITVTTANGAILSNYGHIFCQSQN
jgi:hypothetical protein